MAKFGGQYQTYRRFGPLNAQLQEVHRRWGVQASAVIVDAMYYMGTSVKENTPFRTGRALAHWRLALNGRPGGYDPKLTEQKGKSIDVSDIESYSLGDRVHLYNKVPYAALLEDGWSSQVAPGQMLRAQAARFPEFVQRAAVDNDLI